MTSNRELKQDLVDLSHRLELIQTVLLVSNPDGPMAAEAYEGLRKTIVGSLKATQVLEASLAQLDQISRSTDDMETIRVKLRELMGIAKIELVEDHVRYLEAFDVIGSGEVQTVTKPAYVALDRGAVVARGVLELSNSNRAEIKTMPSNGSENVTDTDPDSGQDGDAATQAATEDRK